MLPKNSKHFLQPTAEKLDVDPAVVQDVIGFFYEETRRALVEMRGPNIQIDNLGSFKAKARELPKLITKYENHLNVLRPETFCQMATKIDVEKRLERVLNLKKMIEDEAQRRNDFMNKKNVRTNTDMEE